MMQTMTPTKESASRPADWLRGMSESQEVSGFPGSWTPPDIVNFFTGREKADFVADLIAAFRTDITRHFRTWEAAAADSDTRRIQQVSRAITSSADQMGAGTLAALDRE